MTDTWREAYDREQAMIADHPRFNDLIKYVAAAEWCVPMRGLGWLRRNSRTYGAWATRQADGRGNAGMDQREKQRARRLCRLITDDIFPKDDRIMPDGEYEAKVWVAARDYARGRVLYHGPQR